MSDTGFADLLGALDFVVMQRVGPGSFYLHGTPPGWLRRVNARWKGERQLLASRTFPFLDHFLADAEEFWATGEAGRVGSGLSIEPGTDGGDVHFEAWAVTVGPDAQYLVLELKRGGAELQTMLQRAREGLLDHERLARAQEALARSEAGLRREKARAEAVAESHAAVLRTIAHEVRTPVHAIIGLAGLMLDAPLAPAHARFLSLIRSSSETLLTVLNDMLDASRLEAGALPLDERPFDVRETLEEALGAVAVRAAERGLDLASQVELAVPETVIGDRGRWRLVLVTLLAHAVASTPAGDVRVFVEATDQGEGRSEIHVAVQGTASALSDADLNRLLRGAPAGADGGATLRQGMGLLVGRALAERLGGRLWADTQPGGTTLHATASLAVGAGPSSPYLRAHQPALEGKRAWIIGASPAVEQLLIRETRFWGMTPTAARSETDLAQWLAAEPPPDVAIVDPAGLAHEQAVDLPCPVIALVTLDRAQEAAARPVAALLTKPLRTSKLYASLVSLVTVPA